MNDAYDTVEKPVDAGSDQLWAHSALAMAALVAAREVSCVEVVDAHLERIAEVNPALNAVVDVLTDDARAAARRADEAVAGGDRLGPLHGVPFTVKTNIDVAGQATTWGVVPLADAVVPQDAPVVERMRAAGAIPVGRTNMPDMALRLHTDSSLYGLTVNPWNASRTCGGSSGGDGVALATGMAAIGLGNDIGGSLRNPANACGIASIRPSAGRVPDAGHVPSQDRLFVAQLMNVQGPMARRVADVRAALQVLSGAHTRDPLTVDPPTNPRRAQRIAVVSEPPGGTCDPVISAVVRRCADILSDAGYDVVEQTPPRYEEAVGTWAQVILGGFAPTMPQLLELVGADARRLLEASMSGAPSDSASELLEVLMRRDGIAREWAQFLDGTLMLSPTWTQLPFEVGFDVASPENTAATFELGRPVGPANLLGLPSACVPGGRDEATGLPIGVLLTGARFYDEACLDAAEAIESVFSLPTPIGPDPTRL